MKKTYAIGSSELSFELIESILHEGYQLRLDPQGAARIQKCRDYLDQKIENSQ